MDTGNLEKQFARLGARVAVRFAQPRFSVNIQHDARGSLFEVALDRRPAEVFALDVQPRLRHLLLVVRRAETHKFLCGHDERDWFAAAVPNRGGTSTVRAAMDALQPHVVQAAIAERGVKRQHRHTRRNAAFVRQGEWFFLPAPELTVDPLFILRNEPLSRGRGKAHWVEFLCRTGGELVYVSHEYPRGLTAPQYERLISRQPAKARMPWITQRRNPSVFARGRVRHPDHKTIRLDVWHRVLMNTESEAPAMRHLAFLD